MAIDDAWQGYVKIVLYHVMFETEPLRWVDDIMAKIVEGNSQGIGVAEFYGAIQRALQSTVELSKLLPGFRPSEAATREYLQEMQRRMEARFETLPTCPSSRSTSA